MGEEIKKMKIMKRCLAFVVAVLMIASVTVGCGGGKSTEPGAEKEQKSEEQEAKKPDAPKEEKLVIGFSQIGAESAWRTAETESIKKTAKEDPMIELKFSDAQQKQENQIKAIRTFIAQGVDAIALAPVVESGWDTVFTEAKEAGIPIILLDRRADVDESLFSTFIGSDFVLQGENAAKFMIDHFGGDKEVNIVELQGTVGASVTNDRKKGFEEGLKAAGGFKIIKSQSGDFTRAKGKEVMEAFLKSEGDKIHALYAHNDDMALGAVQAIEEYGLQPGKDIIIVGVDGIKDAFQAIAEGKYNCTVECSPLLGPQLVQAVKDLKAGKELPKWIKSEEDVYYGQKAIDALPQRVY